MFYIKYLYAAAKSLRSCPTLCDPIDGSPPGSPVPGILQARTLEWVAISFSNAGKWRVKVKSLSRVWLLATPWTAAYQAPASMGFSRQEYWSGVPLPAPKYLYNMLYKLAYCLPHRVPFFPFFFFCWQCPAACGILVPSPGIKPVPSTMEVQTLNHWTTGDIHKIPSFQQKIMRQLKKTRKVSKFRKISSQ